MSAPVVLAVDPGAQTVGAVVRAGDALLGHNVIIRPSPALSLTSWTVNVLDALDELCQFVGLPGRLDHHTDPLDLVAIEETVAPSSHIRGTPRIINLQPALVTAHVGGAVFGFGDHPDRGVHAVIVPPGSHGQPTGLDGLPGPARRRYLEQLYPAELLGPRTTTGTSDVLRHCRSAWDVAGAAPSARRLQEATAR